MYGRQNNRYECWGSNLFLANKLCPIITVSTEMMTNKKKIIIVVFIVTAIVLAGVRWAWMPLFRPPQGMHSNEVELILRYYPHPLVDPTSLNLPPGQLSMEWVFAEAKMRSYVVLAVGIFAVFGGAIAINRLRKDANKASRSTALPHRP